MTKLRLAVKAEYFNAMKCGEKTEEYRLVNEYWRKRLYHPATASGNIAHREFSGVVITLGYPKDGDTERTLEFPWRGFSQRTITHPHFGNEPVDVFAISVLP
jgi:hypothetical protein